MRDYWRVLAFLRPYPGRLSALLFCILLTSVLSSVGITFVSPILRILFTAEPSELALEVPNGAHGEPGGELDRRGGAGGPNSRLPLPGALESRKDAALRWIEGQLYQGTKSEMLFRVCIWILALFVLKNVFGFFQEILRVQLEHRVILRIREKLYRTIHELPLGFFTGERTGYLMSRVIVDVDMMRGSIVGVMTTLLSNGLMVLIALTFAVLVSWQLVLATLLVVPPNAILVAVLSRKLRRGGHRVQQSIAELGAILQETISGIRIVKAFDVHGRESERFGRTNRTYYREYVRLKILEAMSSPVSEILGILTAVLILGFGGRLVLRGELRADLLFLFLGVMLWVIGPIKKLIKENSTLQQSLAAARRIFEVLEHEHEVADGTGRQDITGLRESLTFVDVNFAYQAGRSVLLDVNLRVGAGEVIALVGPSGAGKSTLVDLVPRFYAPSQGRILLDGVDLQEIELRTLRSLIGMVSQEVILFHDTVARNIAFGAGNVSREEVERAARAANAHDFIERLSEGYDTVVGERGLQLSGGQRQRLAIARAVLKNPPILILDEATSSLDSESERQVQDALEKLMRGRTALVIAHRLSTVTKADRIVVLREGRIRESGTHEELLARGGEYQRLYEMQFQPERIWREVPARDA